MNEPKIIPLGKKIVVLTQGFVYVGDVSLDKDNAMLLIDEAKNIRRWGTTEGLGQLRHGPMPDTRLDVTGDIVVPMHAVVHMIACTGF